MAESARRAATEGTPSRVDLPLRSPAFQRRGTPRPGLAEGGGNGEDGDRPASGSRADRRAPKGPRPSGPAWGTGTLRRPGAGLPWWAKVHAHLEAGSITYVDLAERTGQSERTLRRWIGRSRDADPSHGPAGELLFMQRIADALGWPLWYLADDAHDYPPPEPFLRLRDAIARLPADRRALIVQLLTAEIADLLAGVVDRYGEVHEELARRWRPTPAPGAEDGSPFP